MIEFAFSIEGTSTDLVDCTIAPTQAFTMAVKHDSRLIAVEGSIHPELIAALDGETPSFVAFNIDVDMNTGPDDFYGWTLGVIYSEVACPFWNSTVDYTFNPTKIGTVTYETSCSECSPDDFNSPSAHEDGVSVALADFDLMTLDFDTNGKPIINQYVCCGFGHQPGASGDSVERKSPN